MPLANGQTFADHRIVRLLGSGGMGEVYLAQHPRLPRKVVLKVLSADVSANADYRARFAREAELASELDHPNIVVVHDRDEEDGQLWISMNYVDGLDAARLLAEQFPRPRSTPSYRECQGSADIGVKHQPKHCQRSPEDETSSINRTNTLLRCPH
jgi:serine/threonine protein kinase